jgi:hypothetical protein
LSGDGLRTGGADQHLVHRCDERDDVHREQPKQQAAGAEVDERKALEAARVFRIREVRLARAAEEHDAEELHHDVGGEGGRQTSAAAASGTSMLTNDWGRLGVNRNACSSSHSETKPLSGGMPRRPACRRARATRPRASMDEPAELAQASLVRRVQHGPGGEEQQALEERVIERVIQDGGQRDRREHRLRVGLEQQGEADARRR